MFKSLMEYFRIIPDPRVDRRLKHELVNVLVIAICGILSGCNEWTEIEDYGLEKLEWLRTFLDLPNGIPSHDTFGRIFSILDPAVFQNTFYGWLNQQQKKMGPEIVSIDGKFLNGSMRESGRARSAIAVVSAWASESGICLGQVKSELKKEQGEKRATEELLESLFLKGCILTLDANGASPRIVEKLASKEADFVIGLKSNQKGLLSYAKNVFAETTREADFITQNKGHGRKEVREYWQVNLDASEHKKSAVSFGNLRKKWATVNSFIKVNSLREIKGKQTITTRYYFSSLKDNAELAAGAVRNHWGVENKLHWVLDVIFKEDASRVRIKHASENFALLRRMSLNILKHIKDPRTEKRSIKRKRNVCNWNNAYLLKALYDAPSF